MTKTSKTILLIEDDSEIVNVYKTAFEKADHFKVEVLRLGQEVLEWIEKMKTGKAKKPNIILLDLILPDMNGLDLLKKIKKEEKTKNIPVFILTNYSSSQLEKMGYDLKTEKFLTKTQWPPTKLTQLLKQRLKEK